MLDTMYGDRHGVDALAEDGQTKFSLIFLFL